MPEAVRCLRFFCGTTPAFVSLGPVPRVYCRSSRLRRGLVPETEKAGGEFIASGFFGFLICFKSHYRRERRTFADARDEPEHDD